MKYCDVCLRAEDEHSEYDRKRCRAVVALVALSEVAVERGATPGEQANAEAVGERKIKRYGITLAEVSAYAARTRRGSGPVVPPPPRPDPNWMPYPTYVNVTNTGGGSNSFFGTTFRIVFR